MHSIPPRFRNLLHVSHAAPATVSALMLAAAIAGAQAPPKPPSNPPPQASTHSPPARHVEKPDASPLSEGDIRNQLQAKTLYLRGGYSTNDLRFDTEGGLMGNSPQASHTLSIVQIDKIHLGKHQLQLEGVRYGIHYLYEGPPENPKTSSEKLRITPKKKSVTITIQRIVPASQKQISKFLKREPGQPVPFTTQADANRILKDALHRIFSADLDKRMLASLPDFWQLYYGAEGANSIFKPSDPSVLRQSAVDKKARLLTNFAPPSSELAQKFGVVGVAQYHVVVGSDGKPEEIAVGRPIGFGLDEGAVASIRRASFEPAMKGGQPVPVLLDLVVEFRIYSNRTGPAGSEGASATLSEPGAPLPGPYSANPPKQP